MRTVPTALLWELTNRGRWWLPSAALGAMAFPLLLFGALKRDGAFDPADPKMISMQSILMQIGMVIIGSAMFGLLSKPSRLFTRPISNSGLVLTHLLPAGVITAVIWALCTIALNALLPLDWPVLGPALFAAVAVPALMAACWSTEKTLWLFPAIGGTGAFLGLWFRSRFGPVFGDPTHLQWNVTGLDFVVLLAVATATYFAGVSGVAMRRRNETLSSFDLQAWLERLLDPDPTGDRSFPTPERAQLWAEQTRKAAILPGLFVISSLIFFAIWLVDSRDPQALLQGVMGGGIVMAVGAGVISAIAFNLGVAEGNWSMGPFIGTRPISSAALARCTLAVQFRSVAVLTAMWLMTVLGAYFYAGPMTRSQASISWGIPLLIASAWVSAGTGSTIALTGRAQFFGAAFMIVLFSLYGFAGLVQLVPSSDTRQELLNTAVLGTVFVLAVAVVLGTPWAFAKARRRGMIESRTVATAILVAIGLAVCAVWGLLANEIGPFGYIIAAAGICLAVAPLATAPLAVTWNRSR